MDKGEIIIKQLTESGYKLNNYGYRKETNYFVHWVTLFESHIHLYGYIKDDECGNKAYDTGLISIKHVFEDYKKLTNENIITYLTSIFTKSFN